LPNQWNSTLSVPRSSLSSIGFNANQARSQRRWTKTIKHIRLCKDSVPSTPNSACSHASTFSLDQKVLRSFQKSVWRSIYAGVPSAYGYICATSTCSEIFVIRQVCLSLTKH
jgi:hypothetical protein